MGCDIPGGQMDLPRSNTFCFDDTDTDDDNWMPQGITTVADAQADEYWGSAQAILVSWYNKISIHAGGIVWYGNRVLGSSAPR
ncbi:hypothetical protein ABZ639_06605 [Saccharomonospora sp. NPDC006951]